MATQTYLGKVPGRVYLACCLQMSVSLLSPFTWFLPESTVDGEVYGRSQSERHKLAKEEAARLAFRRLLWKEVLPIIEPRLKPTVQ